MPKFVMIHDLPNPDDPQRRSYKECNAERQHAIPIGALVEELPDSEGDPNAGVRLFVARHDRDCDQTPLYALGYWEHRIDKAAPRDADGYYPSRLMLVVARTGYPEESLRVVARLSAEPDPAG